MTIPEPSHPLDDSCSTLYNNTLYSYTADAFQSLALESNATWTDLPMGVAVQGGVCVKSTPPNDASAAALYIVGGSTNSSTYQGLQRYVFANKTWETVTPQVPVTQNRLYHGAVYLNASDSILVYAGTQDGTKQFSSQTFTIQASAPYTVLAFQAIAPPAINPMLMQWSESKALYIGGSETNTKAMLFSPTTSWVDSNATLADPIYNTSVIKAVVANGDDSSKSLYTFDMTISPNEVNRTILVDGSGNPIQNAVPIVNKRDERTIEAALSKNLTIANWPTYNDSLAPSSTRTTYSLAEDQSGLVVISGGSTDDVLCMFKARDNCWENATEVFSSKAIAQQGLGASSSASSTATGSSLSATSTAAAAAATAAPSGSNDHFPVKTLGAVLGSIIAAALIVIVGLALLRWRKKRRQYTDAGHQRRSSGIPDEKNAMDFADRGLPQMVSTRQFPGHQQQDSQGSFSSMAILMGRVGHKRSEKSLGSDSSSQFNQKYKTAISKPIPQEEILRTVPGPSREGKAISFAEEKEAPLGAQARRSTKGARRGSTRRSSGWNRYWSGGSGLNILGFGSKRSTYESDRSSDSHYSDHRLPSQVTQNSAVPAPLKLGVGPELSKVMSGSPTIAHHSSNFPLTREMTGTIERSGSISSMSSYDEDRHDAFSSGVPASVHEQNAWMPVERQDWALGRAQSNYTESNYQNTLPRSTVNYNGYPPPQRQPPSQPTSDMSWLNLGGDSRI